MRKLAFMLLLLWLAACASDREWTEAPKINGALIGGFGGR